VVRKEKFINGIKFQTSAYIKGQFYKKNIIVLEDDVKMAFKEKIMLLSFGKFQEYFKKSGFEIKNVFGDYELNAYSEKSSHRMIFFVEKNM
jgi:hypothetical protein